MKERLNLNKIKLRLWKTTSQLYNNNTKETSLPNKPQLALFEEEKLYWSESHSLYPL